MPLDNLFEEIATGATTVDRRRALFEYAGLLGNPFPSAAQTSGHPHMTTDVDSNIDNEVKTFYGDRNSHAIVVTATQGVGKTNLLNAYEKALREKLSTHGFFVIRYMSDPDPSFDPLIRSIFENLNQDGNDHLKRTIAAVAKLTMAESVRRLEEVRTAEVRNVLRALLGLASEGKPLEQESLLAQQWLMGLPVRKPHREQLGIHYRLDTVEAKMRALRDIIYFSYGAGTLQGVFLLMDELEKQFAFSRTTSLRYLLALRALIDALPRFLFLMVAMTTDALDRYREMVPALRGRLANVVYLLPLRGEDAAVALYSFYLNSAREDAVRSEDTHTWKRGRYEILSEKTARDTFTELASRSTIQGVRQRDFLNALHEKANAKIETLFA